jgi:predicted dehydrogenase
VTVPKRVSAHVVRQSPEGVEELGSVIVVCESGLFLAVDVSWRHLADGERFWFDLLGTKGSAGIQPLRIVKDVKGIPTDVTPTGATGRETQFAQSYRAEWTYFRPPRRRAGGATPNQLLLQRVIEAVYRSADEGRDVLL